MKCIECPDYTKCVKESNLAIKRKNCPKAKKEKVKTNADRIRAMNNVLDSLPAVDAVPVVRCKYCKKAHPELTRCDDVVWCAKWGTEMKLDSFCSYGERRCNHA